ncbi:MAG: 2TM domain-containing protein [Caldisericia bacterium]|nr:2TM domain-containing protein [Caldisericia bacterium]
MEEEKYQEVKKRVEEIRGFYSHLLAYVLVNILLFIINLLTSPGVFWFYWPLLGWGIGVLVHAIGVFGLFGFLGKEWEERKIKELMEKEKRQ